MTDLRALGVNIWGFFAEGFAGLAKGLDFIDDGYDYDPYMEYKPHFHHYSFNERSYLNQPVQQYYGDRFSPQRPSSHAVARQRSKPMVAQMAPVRRSSYAPPQQSGFGRELSVEEYYGISRPQAQQSSRTPRKFRPENNSREIVETPNEVLDDLIITLNAAAPHDPSKNQDTVLNAWRSWQVLALLPRGVTCKLLQTDHLLQNQLAMLVRTRQIDLEKVFFTLFKEFKSKHATQEALDDLVAQLKKISFK